MPLTRTQKEELVSEVTDKLSRQKSVVFSLYQGLSAANITDLRKSLATSGCEYRVVKNTLLKRAFEKAGIDSEGLNFEGPVAVAFSYEDEVAAAKVLNDFAKDHEALQITSGLLENKVLDEAQVKALASLPSKEELLASTVFVIKGPVSGFVGVLAGTTRKLVRTLQLVSEAKGDA